VRCWPERAFASLGTEVDVSKFTGEESVRYLAEATSLDDPDGACEVAAENYASTWEPPIGIEPMTCSLRVNRSAD
jgi:hypothetical protein